MYRVKGLRVKYTRATSSSGPATEDQLERTDFASVAAEEPQLNFQCSFICMLTVWHKYFVVFGTLPWPHVLTLIEDIVIL
jgi:hypothetical protein